MNWFIKPEKPEESSDEDLLERFRRKGDLKVLGDLFSRHSAMVYYVCYRYLQEGEQSKDAVMQIFEELIKKVSKQEVRNFASWLYVLTKNYCLMQLRSGKKMHLVSFEEFVEFPLSLHQDDRENKEHNLSALEKCLEKLPEKQKQSIHLFFLNEKGYKEITDLTGYSLGEVKSYIQNGKRNLKICMERNREE